MFNITVTMKYFYAIIIAALSLTSCRQENFRFIERVDLADANPIGITTNKDEVWVSDAENNRILIFDHRFKKLRQIEDLDRPMHIEDDQGRVFVPEYGSDQIRIFEADSDGVLELSDTLDAPAGLSISGTELAIADFYNHSILHMYNGKLNRIGEQGSHVGQLNYPTDVQIFNNAIYVADAYNNRVQVFDRNGASIAIIGELEEMNASTGIFVDQFGIFVTDYENGRVLNYAHDGQLLEIITEGIKKPSDVIAVGNEIWITDFEDQSVLKFSYK